MHQMSLWVLNFKYLINFKLQHIFTENNINFINYYCYTSKFYKVHMLPLIILDVSLTVLKNFIQY